MEVDGQAGSQADSQAGAAELADSGHALLITPLPAATEVANGGKFKLKRTERLATRPDADCRVELLY